MRLIGLTGSIGAGKSIVSRILRILGYEVYDCDSQAKEIMERSAVIREALCNRWGTECFNGYGRLNRKFIAERAFRNSDEREWLNSLVHAEVRRDVSEWGLKRDICFVEAAILASSGLAEFCEEIWLVTAPESLRLQRAFLRGGISMEDLRRRNASQEAETDLLQGHRIMRINNSEGASLLVQIKDLINRFQ